jgi:deoxyribodipyrimidine photolyase-related protein
MVFVILPNQLFENIDVLKGHDSIYMIEEPIYFYDEQYRPLRPNKVKLAYMRACMRVYYDYLRRMLKNTEIHFYDYKNAQGLYKILKSAANVEMYDTVDFDVTQKYISFNRNIKFLKTPMFILSNTDVESYGKSKTTLRHDAFYTWMKKRLSILEDVKSQDYQNRAGPPRAHQTIGHDDMSCYRSSVEVEGYYTEAMKYISENNIFKLHTLGDLDTLCSWPITFSDAKKHFQIFLSNRFKDFGKYQDAISEQDYILYHSAISPLLNIGLLTPEYVVKETQKYVEKHDIPLNSYEGFIRQVIGWREYMRMCYVTRYTEMTNANHFGLHGQIKDWNQWYYGSTGIEILDTEIKKAARTGFSHHIVRLMVFLNMMILLRIGPHDIYRWFMEVVSMDAYDWVMKSNIWCMGWYYTDAMSKVYVSSASYLVKMSNYETKGMSWPSVWTSLFYQFLKDHKNKLVKGSAVYLRNVGNHDQEKHFQLASSTIKRLTISKSMGRR